MKSSNVLIFFGLSISALAIAAAGLAPAVVSQSNKMFSVANLQVKIGQKIIFKNDDNVPHNIYSLVNGSKIDAGLKKPGENAEISFDKSGNFRVGCAIHPKMKLDVEVTN